MIISQCKSTSAFIAFSLEPSCHDMRWIRLTIRLRQNESEHHLRQTLRKPYETQEKCTFQMNYFQPNTKWVRGTLERCSGDLSFVPCTLCPNRLSRMLSVPILKTTFCPTRTTPAVPTKKSSQKSPETTDANSQTDPNPINSHYQRITYNRINWYKMYISNKSGFVHMGDQWYQESPNSTFTQLLCVATHGQHGSWPYPVRRIARCRSWSLIKMACSFKTAGHFPGANVDASGRKSMWVSLAPLPATPKPRCTSRAKAPPSSRTKQFVSATNQLPLSFTDFTWLHCF